MNLQTYSLPAELAADVDASLRDWAANDKIKRLWAQDPTVWTGAGEGKWLGWLGIVKEQLGSIQRFSSFADEVKKSGFRHALLLGMGGSSLCPEVFSLTFGRIDGFPELHVLDSTDPAQIRAVESKIDIRNTLFFVSSKSGSTLEPNIFQQYFFERVGQTVGDKEAGRHFVAITDPGSKLEQVAKAQGFRRIFYGLQSIGGRYSALSDFGVAPAAAMGVDIAKFFDHTNEMVHACGPEFQPNDNPGVILGAILGSAHNRGRDKVTIVASPGVYDVGAWLEQLLAESTGKNGKGLVPVDREPLGTPDVYGEDRVFAYLRLDPAPDAAQDAAIEAIERTGQPVVRVSIADAYDLGQEFFRWEVATAVAGSIIGINPFDQPDVEASKVATRALTDEYQHSGSLPGEEPFFEADEIKLFADERNIEALRQATDDRSLRGYLKSHLNRLQTNDYFAVLAYIENNHAHEDVLQSARHAVRDRKRVATCLGFGPRFLHSTGQAYKGGPNSGVFLQITCDDRNDLPVPGQKYTFGVVKAAQARGDFQVLAERGRRALRVHLGPDLEQGLTGLESAIREAVS